MTTALRRLDHERLAQILRRDDGRIATARDRDILIDRGICVVSITRCQRR